MIRTPESITPHSDRRTFLRRCAGCLGHLALTQAVGGLGARELFGATAPFPTVQEVPWGRIEEVAEGIWALVSTPLQDRRTLCNGGIVEGPAGVVMVEAFGSPEGAAWMAEEARRRTGRWPDRVVVTHYHGDHTSGLPGLTAAGEPTVRATEHTLRRTRETAEAGDQAGLLQALAEVRLLPSDEPTTLDLGGGRILRLVPRSGHTGSDVTVEVEDPSVVFCGDLVWNRFFPNFVDTLPSRLSTAVRELRRDRSTAYVAGHGPTATPAELELYLELLDRLEEHARTAHARGVSASEAAADFTLPDPLASWYRFSDAYPERALGAWFRELDGGAPASGAGSATPTSTLEAP